MSIFLQPRSLLSKPYKQKTHLSRTILGKNKFSLLFTIYSLVQVYSDCIVKIDQFTRIGSMHY